MYYHIYALVEHRLTTGTSIYAAVFGLLAIKLDTLRIQIRDYASQCVITDLPSYVFINSYLLEMEMQAIVSFVWFA